MTRWIGMMVTAEPTPKARRAFLWFGLRRA
jgi:hypothetical protein